jgi:hypothetical protein
MRIAKPTHISLGRASTKKLGAHPAAMLHSSSAHGKVDPA